MRETHTFLRRGWPAAAVMAFLSAIALVSAIAAQASPQSRTAGATITATTLTATQPATGTTTSQTGTTQTGTITVGSPGGTKRTLAENKAAARADARQMLSLVTLPAGAVRVPNASRPKTDFGISAEAVDEASWILSADTMSQVIAYVNAHAPAGSSAGGSGFSGGRHGITSEMVEFDYPQVNRILGQRDVQITATPRSAGGSRVTVEADSEYIVPRTAASMIPAATRSITATVTNANGKQISSRTTHLRSRVAATVRYFNGLEAGQPMLVMISCPAFPTNGDTLAITFQGATGQKLAQAAWQVEQGGDSGVCDAAQLTVHGHAEGTLMSTGYVATLHRLLGVTVPPVRGFQGVNSGPGPVVSVRGRSGS